MTEIIINSIENKYFRDEKKGNKTSITINMSNHFEAILFIILISLILASLIIWLQEIGYGIIILYWGYKRNKKCKK